MELTLIEVVGSIWRELRLAFRRLERAPGFLVVAALLLGLGIGASTAIVGAVDAMVVVPLVPDEERVFVLHERRPEDDGLQSEISLPHFHDWRAMSTSFREMAAFGPAVSRASLFLDDGEPMEVETAGVSPTFFETLRIEPFLGRGFRLEEDEPTSERVAVLGFELWQQAFGGDPEILGSSVVLEQDARERYSVIGVMPRGFDFPRGARLWTPLRKTEPLWPGREFQFLFAVGRLDPNVTLEEARTELDTLIPQIYRDNDLPQSAGKRLHAVPIADYFMGESTGRALFVLLGAVSMLFLVACVNVAGLCLAQSLARRKETAVRTALGASRCQVARTFLAEAALLAAAGGLVGIVVARVMLALLLSTAEGSVPRLDDARIDSRAFLFALAAAAGAALLVTLVPSMEALRMAPAHALSGGQGSASARTVRLRDTLVLAEVALTVVLVVGAGLFSSSYLELLRVELGYRPEHVLVLDVKGAPQSYPSVESRRSLITRTMERLRAIPEVTEVGTVLVPPFRAGRLGWDLWWAAESQSPPWETIARTSPETGERVTLTQPSPSFMEGNPRVNWEAISGSYFDAMRIPVLRGRTFTDDDVLEAPRVVIVNERFAESVWPGADPVGQRLITLGHRRDEHFRSEWQVVVGVVADARYRELTGTRFDIYVPYQQSEFVPTSLVLRTSRDPMSVIGALRRAVTEVDPNLRLVHVRAMTDVVSGELVPWRFQTTLITAFAIAALVVAVLGVSGAVSQSVAQRARELGLRMVLGASTRDIVRLVVRRGMRPVLLGLAVGLPAAFSVARTLDAHLYEVVPEDPSTFLLVGLVIGFAAAAACYLPAKRATRLEPAATLRSE